jgi:hypothetical protein
MFVQSLNFLTPLSRNGPLENIPQQLLDAPGFPRYLNAVQRPYKMDHVHCDEWYKDHTCDKHCIKMMRSATVGDLDRQSDSD